MNWVLRGLFKIQNKEKCHGVLILELVELGLVYWDFAAEKFLLTATGIKTLNHHLDELKQGKVLYES